MTNGSTRFAALLLCAALGAACGDGTVTTAEGLGGSSSGNTGGATGNAATSTTSLAASSSSSSSAAASSAASSTLSAGSSSLASSAAGSSSSGVASSSVPSGGSSSVGSSSEGTGGSSGSSAATGGSSSGSSSGSIASGSGSSSGGSSSGGSSAAPCQNDPGCTGDGGAACAVADGGAGAALGTCAYGADGCLHVTQAAPCPSTLQTCPAGANACACPSPAACTLGSAECVKSQVATCADDVPGGCPVYGTPASCPNSDQTCKSGKCACGKTSCKVDGPFCVNGTTEATCTTNSADSCLDEGPQLPCPGPETCQGDAGSAACACPAVSAKIGVGLGCATLGATGCDPVTFQIDSCTAVDAGTASCDVWSAPATGSTGDCVSQQLACNTQGGGTPACQCPAHAAGAPYFVDPVNGGPPGTGLFPTGVQSPAKCTFGTLTAALAVAQSGGTVEATGSTPATFTEQAKGNSEAFPLAVPAGVTLTTSAAVLTPADFVIAFNDAKAQSAITLGPGASLSGFTVSNSSGNAAASAISCSTGDATIDGVDLVAKGTGSGTTLATGLSVTGAGGVTATALQASGFKTAGISVTGSGSSTLDGGALSANATGLTVTGGTLALTGVVISGSTGDGVSLAAPDGGAATLTLTDCQVTGNGLVAGNAANGVLLANGSLTVNGGAVNGNGASGLLVQGGAATLGTDAAGLGAAFDGNSANSNADGVAGIAVSGGSLSATGIDASGNLGNASGVAVTGGSSITLTSATLGNELAADGGADGGGYRGNAVDGLYVLAAAGTAVAVHGALISVNAARGVELASPSNAATVDIDGTGSDGGTLIAGNGISLHDADVRGSAGTLTVTGSAAAPVVVSGAVKGLGFNLTGATATLTGVTITGNGTSGVAVAEAVANAVTLSSCALSGNGADGVHVDQAPELAGVSSLLLESLTVENNGGDGVNFAGDDGAIGATLQNSTISANSGVGVLVAQPFSGASFEVAVALSGNTVTQNDLGAKAGAGGGFTFSGPAATVQNFFNNVAAGNGGAQILVSGGGSWTLNGSSSSCATANQIYCYSSGAVGLLLTATTTTVNAGNNSWANDPPLSGTDYGYSSGATTGITAAPACSAVASACP